MTDWLSNDSPPWAAYRTIMGCCLVALDKCPCVRPVGIDEVWRRAIAKCALKACGEDAKVACGSTQLCAGLEAGIKGAVHAVNARAAERRSMEFGKWEVDNGIWSSIAEEGEVQKSLPEQRVREVRERA